MQVFMPHAKMKITQFMQLPRLLHSRPRTAINICIRKYVTVALKRHRPTNRACPFSEGILKVITDRSSCFGCHLHSETKTHTCGELCAKDVGKFVTLRGFLQYQRVGLFCILRDSFGITQIIVNNKEFTELLEKTPYESYIEASGEVILRPVDQINKAMITGEVEIVADKLNVLSISKRDIPFNIRDYVHPTERLKSKYRYLDLRRSHLQENLRFRSKLEKKMRDVLEYEGFIQITTPTLSFATTGGANEFVVRTQLPGEYFSLVQSPQTYKQLLIIGGIDKYFQFAICYRDESGKSDRQPEFTQLDLEMADTTVSEIRNLMERIIIGSWPKELPELETPFPSISYEEAMQNYGVDKPDLRFQWKISDVSSLICQSDSRIFSEAMKGDCSVAKAFVVPGGEKHITKNHIKKWEEIAKNEAQLPGVISLTVQSDMTLKGKAAKALTNDLASELTKSVGASEGDMIVLAVGQEKKVLKLLGKLRLEAADALELQGTKVRDENDFRFVWVVDFPLFERNEMTGKLESCHHPFTAPIPEHLHLLEKDPLKVTSQHYDLVLNGAEVAGGSIRIHEEKLQKQVFNILREDFSELDFFLEALSYGAPPHGGIALGFDRYVAILRGTKSIRDVMAFPKTGEGRCTMSRTPYAIAKNNTT